MIEFTLLGIPVRVLSWHWIGLVLLGALIGGNVMISAAGLPFLLLFMLGAFLSVLIHEMAHALVGRRYGGGGAVITLVMLGGQTQYFNHRPSRFGNLASTAAGCCANLLCALLGCILCFILMKGDWERAMTIIIYLLGAPTQIGSLADIGYIPASAVLPYVALGWFMWTSFWWGLFNLLPIYPMDGGQLLIEFMKSRRLAHRICFALALFFGLMAITYHMTFMAVMMIFMAYANFIKAREAHI